MFLECPYRVVYLFTRTKILLFLFTPLKRPSRTPHSSPTVITAVAQQNNSCRCVEETIHGAPSSSWHCVRWGYGFCHGSFGVEEYNYKKALEIVCSLELDGITKDFSETKQAKEIKQINRLYRDLSETKLITINELLKFMLTVKSRALRKPTIAASLNSSSSSLSSISKPFTRAVLLHQSRKPLMKESQPAKYKKFSTVIANMDSWSPPRRLEVAADAIVGMLKEKKESCFGNGGTTGQDVCDVVTLHIDDTGLLDYVLKSLNNVLVGNQIICGVVNPVTRILEYTNQEVGDKVSEEQEMVSTISSPAMIVPGIDVYSDVLFLYKHVLIEYPDSELVDVATQMILDTKRFVKEWPLRDEEDQLLTFICRLLPSSLGDGIAEIVHVPLHATFSDLKGAVECALRDTYCVTEKIDGLEEVEDWEVLYGRVESGSEIRVRGVIVDLEDPLRHQGGCVAWKVVCECGARDDDGERMMACDICEVWQHTRCCGIEDAETIPPLFVCFAYF